MLPRKNTVRAESNFIRQFRNSVWNEVFQAEKRTYALIRRKELMGKTRDEKNKDEKTKLGSSIHCKY